MGGSLFIRPPSNTPQPRAWPRGGQRDSDPPGARRAVSQPLGSEAELVGTWGLEGDLLSQAGLIEEPGRPLAGASSEGHRLEH